MNEPVQFEAKFHDLGTCYILTVIQWSETHHMVSIIRPNDYNYHVVSLFLSRDEAIGVARFLSTFSLEVIDKVYDRATPLHVFAEEERKTKQQ